MQKLDTENLKDSLTRLGLSEREALIYLYLLQKGECTIVSIASGTSINRPAVYDLLSRMTHRGLVSAVKKRKRELYTANHPDMLKPYVERTTQSLFRIVEGLSAFAKEKGASTNISVFYGKEGIRSVFLDLVTILNKGDIFYRFSGPTSSEEAESYLPHNYRKLRDEKGLERYVITRTDIAEKKKKRLERDMKILPGKALENKLTKIIYANRVAYIDYEKECATVVYDKVLADFEKEVFMSLWRVL